MGPQSYGRHGCECNGCLLEAEARLRERQSLWTRIENDDRTTDLLGAAAPPEESVVGRVQAYTGGYAHRILETDWSALELGAQMTVYSTPGSAAAALWRPPYGRSRHFALARGTVTTGYVLHGGHWRFIRALAEERTCRI